MTTFLIFIGVLSVLVLVHEFGHFWFAKKSGMKVEEFGFGFPPRLFAYKKGETEYSINLIPFGGFVKIFGEDGNERDNGHAFTAKSFWWKMAVVLAGVGMNMLLAVVLLWIVNVVGIRAVINDPAEIATDNLRDVKVQVARVAPGSPIEQAGVRPLDELIAVSVAEGARETISSPAILHGFVESHIGQPLKLEVRRGDETIVYDLTPRQNPPEGEGRLGVQMAHTGVASFPIHTAFTRALLYTYSITIQTLQGYGSIVYGLLTTAKLSADVSGPVGIAVITRQASDIGFAYLLQFMAAISINLAVLNSLPLPALDGGRALLRVFERLRGRPLSKRIEGYIHTGGFALLLAFMIYVTVKDVIKFF